MRSTLQYRAYLSKPAHRRLEHTLLLLSLLYNAIITHNQYLRNLPSKDARRIRNAHLTDLHRHQPEYHQLARRLLKTPSSTLTSPSPGSSKHQPATLAPTTPSSSIPSKSASPASTTYTYKPAQTTRPSTSRAYPSSGSNPTTEYLPKHSPAPSVSPATTPDRSHYLEYER